MKVYIYTAAAEGTSPQRYFCVSFQIQFSDNRNLIQDGRNIRQRIVS